jgi:hypothetical protein
MDENQILVSKYRYSIRISSLLYARPTSGTHIFLFSPWTHPIPRGRGKGNFSSKESVDFKFKNLSNGVVYISENLPGGWISANTWDENIKKDGE